MRLLLLQESGGVGGREERGGGGEEKGDKEEEEREDKEEEERGEGGEDREGKGDFGLIISSNVWPCYKRMQNNNTLSLTCRLVNYIIIPPTVLLMLL